MSRRMKKTGIYRNKEIKRKVTHQLKQTIQLVQVNQSVLAIEGSLKRYRDRVKQYRQKGYSKTTKDNSPAKKRTTSEDIPTAI